MSVFGAYSTYYDLLYKDKDYAGETQYVHELIQKYHPGAKAILNLGCGTGNHDFELAKLGYEITGVDISEDMLAVANLRLSSLLLQPITDTSQPPLDVNLSLQPPQFLQGDIRTLRLDRKFDTVISLFHVMSYQVTNEDLQAAFTTARAHLNPGGIFVFDCWYGPAVLVDPPVVRVKRLEDEKNRVLRLAEPVMHYNENLVDVNYQVMVNNKITQEHEELNELHRMRYLFLPEITTLFELNGLRMVQAGEWLTGKQPGCDTWGLCCVGIDS